MVKRIPVGAHYGFGDWLAQRVSALYMAVYTVAVLIAFFVMRPVGFAGWRAFFDSGFLRAATFVFFIGLIYHTWIGMRSVLMDYAKPTGVRLAADIVVALFLIGEAGWAISILWRT